MRIQHAVSNFSANGQVGPWLYHDYFEPPFDLTLGISYGPTSSYTLGIDYAVGDFSPNGQRQVFITQTTTTITVVDGGPAQAAFGGGLGHCLAVGDTVTLTGTPGGSIDGVYAVASVVNATSYTLTTATSQTIVGANVVASSAYVFQGSATDNIIKLAPVTAKATIGVTNPIFASRLHVTAFTTGGTCALVAIQGGASS
jgi:hypothetical protein